MYSHHLIWCDVIYLFGSCHVFAMYLKEKVNHSYKSQKKRLHKYLCFLLEKSFLSLFNFRMVDCLCVLWTCHFAVAAKWSIKSVEFTFNEACTYFAQQAFQNANKYFKWIAFSAFLSHPFYSYLMNFSLISITNSVGCPF